MRKRIKSESRDMVKVGLAGTPVEAAVISFTIHVATSKKTTDLRGGYHVQ